MPADDSEVREALKGISTVPDVKPLPRWFRTANRAVSVMSRFGFTMGPVCVLTVPGRRTGKPRSTPVSPLTVSGRRYVVAGLPDSDWARNVRAAGIGQLSQGHRRETVTLIEVTDRALKEQVMRAYPQEVPKGAPMFAQFGIVSSPDPEAFAAAASRVAVLEIHPARRRGEPSVTHQGASINRPLRGLTKGECAEQSVEALKDRHRKDRPMSTTPNSAAVQTFMVVGIIRDDANLAEFAALRDDEHKQLEALRSEGKIGAHYVSQPRKATFIEVIAADEKQVAETLATLPFARFFDVDVYPTAPPDEAEAAHRARLSREPFIRG